MIPHSFQRPLVATIAWSASLTACTLFLGPPLYAADRLLRADYGGSQLSGLVLADNANQVQILAADGQLRLLNKDKLTRPQWSQGTFNSSPASQLKTELLREFGKGFDVSGTGHYLVVHPAGQRDLWAARFEEIYRSFRWYFQVRGFPLQQPKFILIAVVFPTQNDFLRFSAQQGNRPSSNVLGYYDPKSNRVYMYDYTAGRRNPAEWQTNAETVIHEVTHQMAFNSGVHSRFGQPPKWVVEGLATLFEAPGVWNGLKKTAPADRVNRAQLQQFRGSLANRPKGALAQFISHDRAFDASTSAAYAESWALSHYLTETNPKAYAKYLQITGAARNSAATPNERVKEFSSCFGTDLAVLEANFLRYMVEIR
jgi:hypothetical protein